MRFLYRPRNIEQVLLQLISTRLSISRDSCDCKQPANITNKLDMTSKYKQR